MDALKPCPFCGGEAEYRVNNNGYSANGIIISFGIVCPKCDVKLPKNYIVKLHMDSTGEIVFGEDEREDAVAKWNERAASDDTSDDTAGSDDNTDPDNADPDGDTDDGSSSDPTSEPTSDPSDPSDP